MTIWDRNVHAEAEGIIWEDEDGRGSGREISGRGGNFIFMDIYPTSRNHAHKGPPT